MSVIMSVILVTATSLPRPDADTLALRDRLAARGIVAEIRCWEEPADWAAARLILLRSPWNYDERLKEFIAWLDRVAAFGTLRNDVAIVRWNLHKRYLIDLHHAGVAIVPTALASRSSRLDLGVVQPGADGRIVAKRAVGAGARGALIGRGDDRDFIAQVKHALVDHDLLLQPFLPQIAGGERSLVFIDGDFSHAVIKRPQPGEWRVQEQYGGANHAYRPSDAEMRLARRAIAAAPGQPLYARADMVTSDDDTPLLMELELIEPDLFLAHDADALDRLTDAVVRRMERDAA